MENVPERNGNKSMLAGTSVPGDKYVRSIMLKTAIFYERRREMYSLVPPFPPVLFSSPDRGEGGLHRKCVTSLTRFCARVQVYQENGIRTRDVRRRHN